MHSPRKSRRLLAVCLLLLPAAFACAGGTRIELQAGRSYMDTHGTNTAFLEAVFKAHPIGNTGYTWAPDVSIGWIDGRNIAAYQGSRYDPNEPSKLVAVGARFRSTDESAWYHPMFFSFQPAWNSSRTLALSSGYQFVSTLGWQARHWSFQVRHVSNGSLHKPNRGETMALLGLAFEI